MSATSSKTEQRSAGLDGFLWFLVVALVSGGVVGNNYYADESGFYRALALSALAIVAALIGLQTSQGKAFAVLARESRVEVGKVVWPNPQERMQTTLVVLALVFVMSLILWGLDSLLGWGVSGFVG